MMFSVFFAWFIYLNRNPSKLSCPNCGLITEGAVFIRPPNLPVYMKCPNCGKRGWLKAIKEEVKLGETLEQKAR